MPQISIVEREKEIKQVSRLDDLKPATEKTITKVQNSTRVEETVVSDTASATFKAAQRASIAAIRHAQSLTEKSDKSEDQEAIDQIEASGRNAISDSYDAALNAKDSLRRQIRKKRPDIKNSKDIKIGTRSIRKADRTLKSTTEGSRLAVKSTIEASKQAAIVSQKVANAKKAERLSRKAAESVKKIVKGIIKAIKQLFAALEAASIPIMLIIVLACAIGALVASAFGIFFTGDVSGESTKTLQEVVLEINQGYNRYIDEIKTTITHDKLTIDGNGTSWPDVVAVYAVYMTTKSDGATDVVHMTADHEKVLYDIFWVMNSVSYTTEEVTVIELVPDLDKDGNQKKDSKGNLLYKEQEKTTVTLHITLDHVTAQQEAGALYFNAEQKAELNELLDPKNASLWNSILGGIISTSSVSIMSNNENCRAVYEYLTKTMGLSHAAACGILANIQYESSFDPHCLGDNGTSYGICQWHAERYTDLKNWCSNHGYDYKTLEGQLHYLEHDLKDLHSGIYNHIKSVENSSDGAYDAGYHWCVYFEIPADKYNKAIERGTAAQNYYWNMN
ncbi:phage tail tip lysozyme [Butyrivibrio sp. AE2032]|uniref:phage tail tip lysozyme n=1 Tax=Butyrivibrio sp. AE2032 TaxID=1458463 RepID=UPI0005523B67|nr:phage tail tip lysozyme [Butyrivibrio sp. AE2032]